MAAGSLPLKGGRDGGKGAEDTAAVRLRGEIDKWRREWRLVRDERMSVKIRLAGLGLDAVAIRADRQYRALKKRQRHISTRIKHMERRLHRRNAAKREREPREG